MDLESFSIDRLPLPSLKMYTIFSFLAASSSIYYIYTESGSAFNEVDSEAGASFAKCGGNTGVILNSEVVDKFSNVPEMVESNGNALAIGGESSGSNQLEALTRFFTKNDQWWSAAGSEEDTQRNVTELDCSNRDYQYITWQLFLWASRQPFSVWPLTNLVYCLFILFSHSIQICVFGNLRSSEQDNIKDHFWNLVFYKIVFVFGVVNVQEVEDAVGWCFFVSVIGFLQLARQLCKERHNYLILMSDMSEPDGTRSHRILSLLAAIFFVSICLFLAVILWFVNSSPKDFQEDFLDFKNIVPFIKPYDNEPEVTSVEYDFNLGLHSAIFMLSEIGLLIIQTFHALTVCVFDRLYFNRKTSKWNILNVLNKSIMIENDSEEDQYMCISQEVNYRMELLSLLFDLVHHVHMLVCCNLFLSMTSLIVSLQMRLRVRQLHSVLKLRQSYTWLNDHIDRYPDVHFDECESSDCAVCWESLASQKSKNLPCNHKYHKTCLRKWLLVSMHCPTCRMSLLSDKEAQLRREREPRRVYNPRPAVGLMGLLQTGQTLLDLFGGWDPLPDEYTEGQTSSTNVRTFSDLSTQDWPPSEVPLAEAIPDTR